MRLQSPCALSNFSQSAAYRYFKSQRSPEQIAPLCARAEVEGLISKTIPFILTVFAV
jgi:hypothetical protein